MLVMSIPKRTKSLFPPKDPSDPSDASVQVMIRVPHWYAQKLQNVDKSKTVTANVLSLLAGQVPIAKPRKRASK